MKYIPDNLSGNFFGGLTSAIVALPLALAFGVASGMGAMAGLYGAICVGFFAAVFGGTPTQISGPTGPMTVVMAAVVTQFSGQPEMVFTVVILAGIIQLLFGFVGLGRYIKLVPQSVVSGFMTGIGVTVILLQLAPFLGYTAPDGSLLVKLAATPKMFLSPNLDALLLGSISFAVIIATPRKIARLFPASLLALIIGVLLSMIWLKNAPDIGEMPKVIPSLIAPDLSLDLLPTMLRFSIILAFLGSIDSLLTSLVADSKTNTQHDPNRELIGQGLGNSVAGLFGGIAGAGATMRTLVNIRAGGTNRLSGATHAIIIILIVVFFSDQARHIPQAVLSGILFKVGIDIIDWRTLKRVTLLPRPGVIIMLTTLLITVFVDLLSAVAVGIVMASVLFVEKTAAAQMKSVKFLFGDSPELNLSEEESAIMEKAQKRIMLFQVEGPLSFASARDISRMMRHIPQQEVLVVNLSNVPFIDSSAAATLEETTESLLSSNDRIIFYGLHPNVMETFEKTDIIRLTGKESIQPDRLSALKAASRLLS